MPELAEVEITRRHLERCWAARQALELRVWDDSLDASTLQNTLNTPLHAARRRAKHLALDFPEHGTLLVHLRMTGRFVLRSTATHRGARVSWHLSDDTWLHFEDMRRLGHLAWCSAQEDDPLTTLSLGPEPWELSDGKMLRDLFGTRTKRTLKDALLDQTVVAGVGNIAISELFWRVGIAPDVRCAHVSDAQLDALVEAMPSYFDALIQAQGDDELEYVNQGGANPFAVYGRQGEPCARCEDTLARSVSGGRSTYWCPTCQKK